MSADRSEASAHQEGGIQDGQSIVEALRWKKIPVLDDGFVCLVDVMGNDGAVVQAARVSYGAGTKKVSDDRGLIRYLLRHRHTTPFEMAEIKLLVRVPMDCWRQWIRHRTACLTGDTQLYFDLPGAEERGRRQRMNVTIEDFFRLWHEGTQHPVPKKKPTFTERVEPDALYSVTELAQLVERRPEDLRNLVRSGRLAASRRPRTGNAPTIQISGAAWTEYANSVFQVSVPMRERLMKMQLRMCDEATGEIRHTTVTDIWETGQRPVFRVTLENGYALKMTADHRCLTEQGWKTLDEATKLRVTPNETVSWDLSAPAFAVNGIAAHADKQWLSQQRAAGNSVSKIAELAGVSYHTIRKSLKKHGLSFTEDEKAAIRGLAQRGRKRTAKGPRQISEQGLSKLRAARSGSASNFWKGGTSTERELIGRWTRDHAQQVHSQNGFKCVLCGSKDELHAHHVDPVWNNAERARDLSNLKSLCRLCHERIHAENLELVLLEAVTAERPLEQFWESFVLPESRPQNKPLPKVRRLVRGWSKIAKIEFLGVQPTYDLSVEGPWHNFVANGFIVHNSVNEYSTRYSLAIDAAQTTPPDQWRSQAANNRQGSGELVEASIGDSLTAAELELQQLARKVYLERIERGIAREQARKDLPLSTYTEAYWKIDLHNLLHFLALRMDSHAQLEIRLFATAIGEQIVKPLFPIVWEAFLDYRMQSDALSRLEIEAIQRLMATAATRGLVPPLDKELFLEVQDETWRGLSRSRERDECEAKLQKLGILK